MRVCSRCQEEKPEAGYYLTTNHGKPYLRAQCRACDNKIRRRTHLRRTYNMTLTDFEDMRTQQKSCCKICGNLMLGRIDIDHNHKTGKIRGLLCINCNGGLGNFKDSIEMLEKAIEYLQNNV